MQWYVNFVNVIFARLICIFKPSSSTVDVGRTIQTYSFFVDNVPGFGILFPTLHFLQLYLKEFYFFHKILKYKFITICLIEPKKKTK